NVDPRLGTLEDFDELLEQAHRRGIRIVVDWVPNHTSDRHPWFLESRSSLENPKRDWYVWRDPAPGGGPPNNWESAFRAVGPTWRTTSCSSICRGKRRRCALRSRTSRSWPSRRPGRPGSWRTTTTRGRRRATPASPAAATAARGSR